MSVEEDGKGITINPTDIRLPRRIGEPIKRAFNGAVEVHFEEDGYLARVDWTPPK